MIYLGYTNHLKVYHGRTLSSKWGNSQGLRLPKDIIKELNLAIGDKIKSNQHKNNKVILEPN